MRSNKYFNLEDGDSMLFSETLVPAYNFTRSYNPGDQHQHLHCLENPKFYTKKRVSVSPFFSKPEIRT